VWHEYSPEQLAIWTDAVDTVSRAAPDVPILVNPHTVAVTRFDLVENIAAGKRRTIGSYIEDANELAWRLLSLVSGFGYV
jgi:hypothetical protein